MRISIDGFEEVAEARGAEEALRILRRELIAADDTVERSVRLGGRVHIATNRDTGKEIITSCRVATAKTDKLAREKTRPDPTAGRRPSQAWLGRRRAVAGGGRSDSARPE